MSFFEVIDQVIEMLRSRERLSYRVAKREFSLDNEELKGLKEELIKVQELTVDKTARCWSGPAPMHQKRRPPKRQIPPDHIRPSQPSQPI